MTFATIAKQKIEAAKQSTILETQRQLQLQQQENREPFEYYHSIVNDIKTSMKNIELGNSKLDINKHGEVFLCTSEKHKQHYTYDSREPKIDFFQHFGKKLPLSEFTEFKEFLKEQNIISIFIYYSHDGCGQESWNSFYAKI